MTSKNHNVRLHDLIQNEVKQKRSEASIGSIESFDLPEYFDLKASKNMQRVINGRHPKSLPKSSELWHYSKLSSQRRSRINKGHTFWEVINEEASLPNDISPSKRSITAESRVTFDDHSIENGSDSRTVMTTGSHSNVSQSKPNTAAPNSSINAQLKQLYSKANSKSALDLKIDWKNKSQINFGMTFIIMNYMDELLYVNRCNELRCKPLNQIVEGDRIKFKMIDLVNPSNPASLRFGDSLWLQCLDSSETADNSFQSGNVLAAKLYGPPELKSMQFDINAYSKPEKNNTDTTDGEDTPLTSEEIKLRRIQAEEKKMFAGGGGFAVPLHGTARARLDTVDSGHDIYSPTAGDDSNTNSPDRSQHKGDKEDDMFALDELPDDTLEDENGSDNTGGDKKKEEPQFDSFGKLKKQYTVKPGADLSTAADSKVSKRIASHENNIAKICGEVNVIRIIELRKGEQQYVHDGVMTDEKATRYNSKQSTHLGRWAVHTAVRPDDHHTYTKKQAAVANALANNHGLPINKEDFVYSLSPIVIQQDLYCIGAAHPAEFDRWPNNSHAVIHKSDNITADEAQTFNDFYEKNGGKSRAANGGAINPADRYSSINNGNNSGGSNSGGGNSVNGSGSVGSQSHNGSNNSTSKNANKYTPSSFDSDHISENPDHGCLRKLVNRGFPYDYSVDRKCVWKFCLFEQFSENNPDLSEKEKMSKKVMETASMVLKLSQLNREGAQTHIHAIHHETGTQLPALVGGESFSRNLREITFKKSQMLEKKYLAERRQHELRLREYFENKIATVIEKEEIFAKTGKLHRVSSSMSVKSGASVHSGKHSTGFDSQLPSPTNKSNHNKSFHSSNNSHNNSFNGSFLGGNGSLDGSTIGGNLQSKVSFSKIPSSPKGNTRGSANGLFSNSHNNSHGNSYSNGNKQNSYNNSGNNNYPMNGVTGLDSDEVSLDSVSTISHNMHHTGSYVSPYNSHNNSHNNSGIGFGLKNSSNARNMGNITLNKLSLSQNSNNNSGNSANMTVVKGESNVYGDSIKNNAALSREIKQIFQSTATKIHPSQLLLTNQDSLANYDKLSEGEKVLALHKTFGNIKDSTEAVANKSKLAPKAIGKPTASMLEKIKKLQAEDAQIAEVLSYKDRQEKIKKTMWFQEEEY